MRFLILTMFLVTKVFAADNGTLQTNVEVNKPYRIATIIECSLPNNRMLKIVESPLYFHTKDGKVFSDKKKEALNKIDIDTYSTTLQNTKLFTKNENKTEELEFRHLEHNYYHNICATRDIWVRGSLDLNSDSIHIQGELINGRPELKGKIDPLCIPEDGNGPTVKFRVYKGEQQLEEGQTTCELKEVFL